MDNAIYLTSNAKTKTVNTEKKVTAAISEMLEAGEKISFYSVSKKTGVSRNFLYNNSRIRNAITDLKAAADSHISIDLKKTKEIDATLLLLENLRQKDEIERLKAKIELLEKRVSVLDDCLMALGDNKSAKEETKSEIFVPF